nr:papain-like cysteine protease family protein [bacterium]
MKKRIITNKKRLAAFITSVIVLLGGVSAAIYFGIQAHNRSRQYHQYMADLTEMAQEYPKVEAMLGHLDDYPAELLDLVLRNPETIDFVLGYPDRPSSQAAVSLADSDTAGGIPLLLQWDPRWGYDMYGSSMMALSGCGPTCLSMVASYLTGNTAYSPRVIADYAQKNGHYVHGIGTAWSLMTQGAAAFGLTATEVPLDAGVITKRLREGKPIIVSVKAGDFTTTGHFIVLTDAPAEGRVTVHDPNSR